MKMIRAGVHMIEIQTNDALFTIVIGENSHDNDKLIAQARQNDIWFHLKKFPSAHVILQCHDRPDQVTKRHLVECATQVKKHGKYRNLPYLIVMYTQISAVHRTETPGLVHVTRYQTLEI